MTVWAIDAKLIEVIHLLFNPPEYTEHSVLVHCSVALAFSYQFSSTGHTEDGMRAAHHILPQLWTYQNNLDSRHFMPEPFGAQQPALLSQWLQSKMEGTWLPKYTLRTVLGVQSLHSDNEQLSNWWDGCRIFLYAWELLGTTLGRQGWS
jgi:hypothetical protein